MLANERYRLEAAHQVDAGDEAVEDGTRGLLHADQVAIRRQVAHKAVACMPRK
jgi:hypothetical protein